MLHVNPRRAAGALAALLAIAGLAAPTATGVEDFTLDRVAGVDRYATAATAAVFAFPEGADAAVLARGDAFPDALAGSYLTGVLGAPILLTQPNQLPAVTADALDDLGVATVYVLGGTGAISATVADEAGEGRDVIRLAGPNRYATAAEVATSQAVEGIGDIGDQRTAILASGEGFADALAAGPVAHAANLPILLTPSGALAAEAATALDDLAIEHVVIVGGTAAVSDGVKAAVEAGDRTTERVAGVNRYATAVAVAGFARANVSGWSVSGVDLATGEGFADALSGGPSSGEAKQSILLTPTTTLAPEAKTYLEANAGTLLGGRVYGGPAAVRDAVVSAAEAAASGGTTGTLEGQLTFIDKVADFYRYVPDGATSGRQASYAEGDVFTVDGTAATISAFEQNASPADTIRHTPAAGGAPARHELTNVDASAIRSGTVGNVDLADDHFDFINPVNGDALVANISYAGASAVYTVDGATRSLSQFEDDINEGDTLRITAAGTTTTFALTNETVEGAANSISAGSNPLAPSTLLKIGGLGDIPETSSDQQGDSPGNDDRFRADGGAGPVVDADEFVVDGNTDATYDDFADSLTEGDFVSYTRVGGVETYTLVNRAPTSIEGQAVDDLDPTNSPLPFPGAEEGGSFTLATASGPVAVTYESGGTFVVNGFLASETDFEAAYSPGDLIKYRQADPPSGTTQRLELTDRLLQGRVDPATVDTDGDTYDVLANDGQTTLATVEYTGDEATANTYFVNGAAADLARFEEELTAIADGTRVGAAQVQPSGNVTQHRLTTTASA
ncbi:MAG TPA: cell wall-binding repeat-containing protein [Acidimicrobiales bacterium]|nr:cell wall-binding repeat-containing protein [Acidimicrobiales bacterium]